MAIAIGTTQTFVTENTDVFYSAQVATAGNNRGLLVFVSTTSQSTPHNMRYNGTTMTQEAAAQEPETGKRIAVWSLVGPATGTNSLQMSFSAAAAMALTVIPLTNADQTDFVTNAGTGTGSSAAVTVTLTSTATETVIDGFAWAGTTGEAGAQQIQLTNIVSGGGSMRNATSYESGSATVTMTWSLGAVASWIAAAVSCKGVASDPVASQGPTNSPVTLFQVANVNTDNSGTGVSLAIEVSGSAAALVVFVANSSANNPHALTYSASALTMEGTTQEVPTGKRISVWSLMNPPTGSNTLTISYSAAVAMAATAFALSNVDQIDMIGNYAGDSGSNTTPTTPLSAQAGELVLYGIGTDFNGNISPTNSDATLRSQTGNASQQLSTASKPSAGTNQLTWSLSSIDDWVHAAVNVKPYVALSGKAPGAYLRLLLARHREMQMRDFYTFTQPPLSANAPAPGPSPSPSPSPAPSNTGSLGPRVSLPPQYSYDDAQWKRQASTWMQEVHQGHLANTGIVTLAANAASTVVSDDRVGEYSFIGLMARTANAAAELASGNVYVTAGKKTFTVAHTNNAQTDRTFTYNISG